MSSSETPIEPQHNYHHGSTLTRRRAMQLVGASIAAGAGSSTALAEDDDNGDDHTSPPPSTLTFNPMGRNTISLLVGGVTDAWRDTIGSDPGADEFALHNQMRRADEWWGGIYATKLDNRLTDAQMIANIEGRVAIADGWEDGKNVSDTYSDVLDTMREYWDTPVINVTEAMRAVLLEIAHAGRVSRELDDYDNFITNSFPDPDDYGGDADPVMDEQARLEISTDEGDDELVEASIELPSGEDYTFTVPDYYIDWEDGDELHIVPDDDLLDAYDRDEEEFKDLETDDGETVDAYDPWTGVASIPDEDEYNSIAPFRFAEWAEIIHEIEDADQEARANYDEEFVEDLFDALDEGRITPSDVRGVEGTAEHLSGSTDATESRYMMALYSQLGLERADLSTVSSMTAKYDGYTGREYQRTDSGDIEKLHHTDHKSELEIQGQLFADLGGGSLEAGYEYACGTKYVFCNSSVSTSFFTQKDGVSGIPTHEDFNSENTSGQNPRYSPDGTKIAYHDQGDIFIHDAETQELLDEVTGPYAEGLEWLPSGDYILVGARDEVALVDADTLDVEWSVDTDDKYDEDARVVAIAPDSDDTYVYASNENFGKIFQIDTQDGEIVNEVEHSSINDLTHMRPGANHEHIFIDSDDEVVKLHIEDSEEIDTYEAGSQTHIAYHYPTERLYVVYGQHGRVHVLDPDTFEELDTSESFEYFPRDLWLDPAGNVYVEISGGDGYAVFDSQTLELIRQYDHGGNANTDLSVWPDQRHDYVDGVLNRTIAYDAPSGEEYNLNSGTIKIKEMVDSDGENVLPWETNDLQDELEEIADDDLENILGEIDEIDDPEDITNTSDVELILEEIDDEDYQDLSDLDAYDEDDVVAWDRPEYDTHDVDDYEEYLLTVTEDYVDSLNDGNGDSDFWTGISNPFDGAEISNRMLAGLAGAVAFVWALGNLGD